MKLTVLGNHAGFPGPNGDACSGYLVEAGDQRILLDCGSGVMANLYRYCAVSDLTAVVLSHLHGDHISDMLVLRYARMLGDAGALPVYMPDQPEGEYWVLSQHSSFDAIAIEQGREYSVGDVKLTFAPTTHPMLNYAVRISYGSKVLVYTGDTTYDETLPQFAAHADLLLCDATFSEATYYDGAPHASAKQAAKMAQKAHVKRLLLTHLSEADPLAQLSEAKSKFGHTALTKPHLTINI